MTLAKPWERVLSLILVLALVTGFGPGLQFASAEEGAVGAAAQQVEGDAAAAQQVEDDADAATAISVSYQLNGGSNASANASSFKSDGEMALAAPKRSGYVFAGWYLDARFAQKVTKLSADMAKDGSVTVYAKWTKASVTYRVKGGSWGKTTKMGFTAAANPMYGVKIYKQVTNLSGSVYYRVKTSKGWSKYVKNGSTASNRAYVRAISVKLTGDMAKQYDVYYRVKAGYGGWLGWTKNGYAAGTSWRSITGMQVKLVKKGDAAPGSSAHRYITKRNDLDWYVQRAYAGQVKNKSSKTKYIIIFSSKYNRIGIYKGSKGNWKLKKYWKCATGAPATPSLKGTFTVDGRGYSFGNGFTCWWWVEWCGDYLFHSQTYLPGSKKKSDIIEDALGKNKTHGCVRLDIKNAKWVYDHIPNKTKVLSVK